MYERLLNARSWRAIGALLLGTALVAVPATGSQSSAKSTNPKSVVAKIPKGDYQNPLNATSSFGSVVNFANPGIIYSASKKAWYAYGTTDFITDKDTKLHLIPIITSKDLIHWKYVGDVYKDFPSWMPSSNVYLWAPDPVYMNGKYYVYFGASETVAGGSAIGVAISSSPAGPFTDGGIVVTPHAPPCCPNAKMNTLGPSVVNDGGQLYIFYGGGFGGYQARKLSADGLKSDPASQTQITIDNKFESVAVWKHGNFWYMLATSPPGQCCNGPLSGYGVYVGRSVNVLGPYVDKQGIQLLDARAGGDPALAANGNQFVGPGTPFVFTDFAKKDWVVYHAIDRNNPYMPGGPKLAPNRRHLMMDPLDYVNGWPTVRGGNWVSNSPMPAPAAQPKAKDKYKMKAAKTDQPGALQAKFSQDFTKTTTLGSQWSWIRPPAATEYGFGSDGFFMNTEAADLFLDTNNASVLLEKAPTGNWVLETKVNMSFPATGCCYNFTMGGPIVYKDDDNYIRLVHLAIFGTRVTEFAKEQTPPAKPDYPRFGNAWEGPPADWTWLRIVKTQKGKDQLYRAYTSTDGTTWIRGSVWTHRLGAPPRIGLVAMGGGGFKATYAYFNVYKPKK